MNDKKTQQQQKQNKKTRWNNLKPKPALPPFHRQGCCSLPVKVVCAEDEVGAVCRSGYHFARCPQKKNTEKTLRKRPPKLKKTTTTTNAATASATQTYYFAMPGKTTPEKSLFGFVKCPKEKFVTQSDSVRMWVNEMRHTKQPASCQSTSRSYYTHNNLLILHWRVLTTIQKY